MGHDGPPLEFGCMDQLKFGKCNASFMFNTIEELPEGALEPCNPWNAYCKKLMS